MLSKIYFSLVEYFCENMGYLYSHLIFFFPFFLLWTSFVSTFLYFCITHVSFYNNFWEKYYQELGAFILIKPSKHIFVFSQCRSRTFWGGWKTCFFAYFKYRSSTYMWCVRDFDLGSMINLSSRVNKTWPNSTKSKQLM